MSQNSILSLAKLLANEPDNSLILPIKDRVAYIVSHGKSYSSNGYAIRTHSIASELNQCGFNVTCMVRPGRPWELDDDIDCEMFLSKDGVEYVHSCWQDKEPSTPLEHLEYSVDIFCEQFKLNRPEFVVAASNWIVALPAWVAAKKLGIPFFYEVRGFWELTRESKVPGYTNSHDYKQEVELDTFVAQQAERVFTLNTAMKNELVERGVSFHKIDIVKNAVKSLSCRLLPNERLRSELGISQNDKVVGYIGSINDYEGIPLLLEACKNLSKTQSIKLLIVGSDSPIAALDEDKNSNDTSSRDWLIKVGRVPHDQVDAYYSLIDVIAIPRLATRVCELVPPMKAVEAITKGKNIVLSDLPALRDISGLKEQTVYFQPNSASELEEALALQLARSGPDEESVATLKEHLLQTAIKPFIFAIRNSRNKQESTREKLPFLVDYATANRWFYKQGNISDTLTVLENLRESGKKLDKTERDFEAFVAGLKRLKQDIKLPPRQPNPGYLTKRRSILYCLHQSVPYTTNGYATRSHGIAKGLAAAGWNIRCATRPGYPWDTKTQGISKGLHEEVVDNIVYSACAGWNLNKTPLDRYFAEATDFYLREAQTNGAELIIAASNHITAIPALTAARRLGIPFVYEMRGLWEVTQASTQPEWKDSERYHLMRKLEQDAALNADLVLTLTGELADEVASWGVPRESIEIIPNAVDEKIFKPVERSLDIKEKLNLPDNTPVIGYAGSAVAYEGLDLLLKALSQLKSRGQEFVFVLVGDGKVFDSIKDQALHLGIFENCRFTGRVPFEEVTSYIACMDIMPIPRLSSAVTEMVSALKPLEAMAMGKAVILSDVSPHQIMAGDNTRALLFKKDNVSSLTNSIQELITSAERRKDLGENARKWIESNRNWNKVTEKYSDALDHLLAEYKKSSKVIRGKALSELTIGLIADTFTTDTIASAVTTVALSPDNWKSQIEAENVDVVFVESAWKGNDWQWHQKIGYYSEEKFNDIAALLHYCRSVDIPTLFWNKEDPVHFERFKKVASLCDHVFTTDSRRIIPYLGIPGAITQTASSCPFYASPKIHNLLPSTEPWKHNVAYGGTYYGERYPERTEYMDKIMSAAAPLGLTIYDRQHSDPDSPYKYPGGLGSYVAGSLTYEAMIQAYKSHPAQINVNSVLDSPTMFSRRVMEVAACGAVVISGPALGMNKYLEGHAEVIEDETQAAQAIEITLGNPVYRWRKGLAGSRAVMRAHTTEWRLAQMLRTAGMVISAPQPPEFQLVTNELTDAAARAVLAQTLRPVRVLASQWESGVQARLQDEGIQCDSLDGQHANANSIWLVADTNILTNLEPEDFEDLAWPTRYAPQTRIGFNKNPELAGEVWPGVAVENYPIEDGLQLVRLEQNEAVSQLLRVQPQPTLALRKPQQIHERAPNIVPNKTVVIAGHDLKFIKPFYPYFTQTGIRVLLDFWTGHNRHNEATSKRLLQQADTVFCEWTLGNAIWYGKHKREGQKLIGRLHLQEIDHVLFNKIPFEAFETVMFVGPHILRRGIEKNPVLRKNGIVVYNGVDVDALQSVPRRKTNGKVLGFVGIVPQRKRFDLALDILRELRKEDDEYILRIKGKRPEEYPWMANRPEEMAWYEDQYKRLKEDPLLKEAVIFDSHGDDMPEWYAGIDFVLSTSDFESFHFTVADGAAAGCTPIILPWEGAGDIYPQNWIYDNAKLASRGIKAHSNCNTLVKNFARDNFGIEKIAKHFIRLING